MLPSLPPLLALPFVAPNLLSLSAPDRYEDEINRRTGAENEFVVLKKVGGLAAELPAALAQLGAAGGPPASWLGQAVTLAWLGGGVGPPEAMASSMPTFSVDSSSSCTSTPVAQTSSASGHIPMGQVFALCSAAWFWLPADAQC